MLFTNIFLEMGNSNAQCGCGNEKNWKLHTGHR